MAAIQMGLLYWPNRHIPKETSELLHKLSQLYNDHDDELEPPALSDAGNDDLKEDDAEGR